MVNFILYLLEASALLALLYALYLIVLSRETFFSLNRFFLISALVASFLFPLLSLDIVPREVKIVETPLEEISKIRMSYFEAMVEWEFEGRRSGPHFAPEQKGILPYAHPLQVVFIILLTGYVAGIVVCLYRNVWTMRWIRSMISVSPLEFKGGATIVKVQRPIAPFSFFQYVFVHEALVDTPEFDQILAHERTHIEQRHSIDLIFVQVLAAFCWFNPVIWQLIKSLKTTHEYIADKKIIASGYSLVEYQTLLLKQLISNNSNGLVHNFNLSFIKKRITMMKNRRSGWSGKLRVALAIAATVIVSAAIVQCNSRLEDVAINSETITGGGDMTAIDLPVLAKTGYRFEGDPADALTLKIANDNLTIDGESYQVDEIASVIKSKGAPSINGHIVMHIDKDQKMQFVRAVEMELRKADRRKILYVGREAEGSEVGTPIVLPPTPENAKRTGSFIQPTISEVETDGKTAILKIHVRENAGIANQRKVYDFVMDQVKKHSSEYVVSYKYDDSDSYGNYLPNLIFIKEGFHQIYQERSHAMFGKDYYDITKEEYKAVRKDVPMAISIAEAP
jgi:biopolymer transport protein ExbD